MLISYTRFNRHQLFNCIMFNSFFFLFFLSYIAGSNTKMEKEKDKDKDKDKDKSKKTGGTLRKFGKRKTTTGTLTNEDLKMMAQIAVEEAAAATPVETGEYNLKIESK